MTCRGGAAQLLAAAGLLLALVACGPTTQEQPGQETETQGSGAQTPPEGCVPTMCEARGATCGTIPDGCGGTLTCGSCAEGLTCGGGGAPNTCGTEACTPTTCEAQGKDCGTISDGCGGTLFCGVCSGLGRCGAGGIPNVCGPPSCTPASCETQGATCGSIDDGCGATLECGSCGEGQACSSETHACVAAPPQRTGTQVWTVPGVIIGLDGEASGSLVFARRLEQLQHAFTKWDANGNVVWERPGFSGNFELRHLSLTPGSGKRLLWGLEWSDTGSSQTALRLAEGGPWAEVWLSAPQGFTLTQLDADMADNLVYSTSGSIGPRFLTDLTYAHPNGTTWWSIHREYGEGELVTLAFREASFSPSGDVVASANVYGTETLGGRTFTPAAGSSLLVALTPTQQVRWAYQLYATEISRVASSASGRMAALARFRGSLTWAGTTLTAPEGQGGQGLLVLNADGTPRALLPVSSHATEVALSPSGRIAVASAETVGTGSKVHFHIVEYAEDLTPRKEWTFSPGSASTLRSYSITWAGEELVAWGEAQGSVDFGTGQEVTRPDPEWSYIVKPQ